MLYPAKPSFQNWWDNKDIPKQFTTIQHCRKFLIEYWKGGREGGRQQAAGRQSIRLSPLHEYGYSMVSSDKQTRAGKETTISNTATQQTLKNNTGEGKETAIIQHNRTSPSTGTGNSKSFLQ